MATHHLTEAIDRLAWRVRGAGGIGMSADAATDLTLADRVEDRDADGPTDAVVVGLPKVLACDYTIDALDGSPTVAELNDEYDAYGPVATVAFAGDLDDALDIWEWVEPEKLAELCDREGVRTYTYPSERLRGTERDGRDA